METVEDILDREAPPAEPKAASPFVPAMLPDTPPLPEPGIYFGMSEEAYFALPALSASGIKDLAASPMLFWAKCDWLSEKARKEKAKREAEEKIHRTIGKAYHCRILEGPEAYVTRFACELSAEQCEGALESTDQIKAAINGFGQKPWSKVPDELPNGQAYERAARKEDWIRQLIAQDPDARILANLQQQHREANAGKSFVPSDAHDEIEISARMIEADPDNRHAVQGGYPEVVLIWTDEATGVPMKARVDYLKIKAIVDLKTIANEHRSIENAIRRSIANYAYNFQPRVYAEGVAAVKKVLRADPLAWALRDDWNAEQCAAAHAWREKWVAHEDEPDFWFLFQAKPPAPVTRLVRYPLHGTTNMITGDIVRSCQIKFRKLSETYGTSPWLDLAPPYDIADEDIPPWATEI